MNKLINTIRYIVFLMLPIVSISAEITDYQVEVIIFEQGKTNIRSSEYFVEGIVPANIENSKDLPNPAFANDFEFVEQPLKIPNHALLKLESIIESINKSSAFRLIKHVAWQQQGLDNSGAFKIRIKSNTPYVAIENIEEGEQKAVIVAYDELVEAWDELKLDIYYDAERDIEIFTEIDLSISEDYETIDEDYEVIDEDFEVIDETLSIPDALQTYLNERAKRAYLIYQLDGTIKVVRTRYLHFYTDLIWNIPALAQVEETLVQPQSEDVASTDEADFETILEVVDEQEIAEQPTVEPLFEKLTKFNFQSYPFKSHRKMRSKRKHYIDHPKIGIITIITPLEKVVVEEKLEPSIAE